MGNDVMRHLLLDGGYNVRDLGGYLTGDGRVTRWRSLIRAGNLDKVTPQAQQQLLDYGVKTVIDLRDEWEVREFPDVFAQSSIIRYQNVPFLENNLGTNPAWEADTQFYSDLHVLYEKTIGAVVAAVADSTFPTIFHCYAGKDRTGIVAALLLGSIGVSDALISEDYALTGVQITHLIAQWRDDALLHGRDMGRFECEVGSDSQTMLHTLAYLRDQYGGVVSYLHRCGVTDAQLSRLQAMVVG
jgi:protein-tyrosine phosphatase